MVDLGQFGWHGLLFALVVGHAFGDFAFQSEFVAEEKGKRGLDGFLCLVAHSLIHAGLAWMITGALWVGFAEFVLHTIIDRLKGEKRFGFATDQLCHVLCKVAYVVALVAAS